MVITKDIMTRDYALYVKRRSELTYDTSGVMNEICHPLVTSSSPPIGDCEPPVQSAAK